MRVEFQKTGERRYAVIIWRDDGTKLEMNPAPGFDPLMPHDLLHFLVEQELGLRHAIFGHVAAGGGTFRMQHSESKNDRQDARQRRKLKKKGEKMLRKEGMDEYYESERATYICLQNWFANSPDLTLRARADEMRDFVRSAFESMNEKEKARFNKEKLAQIRKRMDDLSQRWSSLKINQSISLEW